MTINRNFAGIGDRGVYSTKVDLTEEGTLKLHIYLDRSSIEMFANDGEAAASARFYPHWQESLGVNFYTEGGATIINQLNIWQLNSAWRK